MMFFLLLSVLFELPNSSPLDEQLLFQSRSFFSDFPELAKIFWSRRVYGPCGSKIGQDGFLIPCSAIPATPREFPYPSAKMMIHQNLTYQPPLSGKRVGSLAISYQVRIISFGIIWDFVIDAKGIRETLFLVQYEEIPGRLQIAPGIYIRIKNLRAKTIYQINKGVTGNFSFREHKILDWSMPSAFFNQAMFYDLGSEMKCGTPTRVIKSLPAAAINTMMSLASSDAGELFDGDENEFYLAEVGTRGCGEVPYLPWFRRMTHRDPDLPIREWNGIAVEFIRKGASRDPEDFKNDSIAGHSRVDSVNDELRREGFTGQVMNDEALEESLARLEQDPELDKNATSTSIGDMAFAVAALLETEVQAELGELFIESLGHVMDDPNHHDDSTIHFNPLIEREIPFFPAGYYADEAPANVLIRKQIVAHPFQPFTMGRLLLHNDFWEPYSNQRFYRKGMFRARQLEEKNINRRLEENQEKQARWSNNSAVLGLDQNELEQVPLANGNSHNIVYQVPPYQQCLDPSETFIEKLAFREVSNLGDLECGLLIRVVDN